MNEVNTGRGPQVKKYVIAMIVVAAATLAVLFLLQNISTRKREAQEHVFRVAEITEETIDPAIWGRNYPRQFDSYRRTVDTIRTRYGGSEAFSHLDNDTRWIEFFHGYAFSIDYREERGHAYMLSDQEMTERVKQFKQPGACLHCHAAVIPAYRNAAMTAGAGPDSSYWEKIVTGFMHVNAMPYADARKLVEHPVSCGDCHDPASMQLRVTRPGFYNGIQRLAESADPVPHFPSITRWRAGSRRTPYDPNVDASRQELRSMVCGQCHVEYYFKGDSKTLTYPWHNGLTMDSIERYYNDAKYKDWTHASTGAPMLKAQHPEFEMWSQGIHARSGVACADCHMPYVREGAIKVSDHHVRSPLLNVARACQTCHRFSESELVARVETIQGRHAALMDRAEGALMDLVIAIKDARKSGADTDALMPALVKHREAQWRLDFVSAENSMGFHAPQEGARILAEAIDQARQGELAARKVVRR